MQSTSLKYLFGYRVLLKCGYLLLALLLFSGCSKEPIDTVTLEPVEPEYGITVFQTEFSLKDAYNLVDDTIGSFLTLDENDVFRFEYDYHYQSKEAQEYLRLDDLNASDEIRTTIPGFSIEGQVIPMEEVNDTITIEFGDGPGLAQPNGELEAVDFKGGDLGLTVTSTFPHDVELTITFPGLVRDGMAWSRTISFDYEGQPLPLIQNIPDTDLEGYSLDLTGGGTGFNTVQYMLDGEITLESSSGTDSVEAVIDYEFALENLEFAGIYGYLENLILPFDEGQDSQEIDVFGDFGLEVFELGDPQLNLTVANESGHRINGHIQEFEFTYDTKGTRSLEGAYQTEFANIDPAPGPGQASESIRSINNDNSNLSEALVLENGEVAFDFDAALNVDGKEAGQQYFLLDTSKVTIDVQAAVPVDFRTTSGFILEDTLLDVSFAFADHENGDSAADILKEVELRFKIRNGFPVDVSLQFYGYDKNGAFVDSLLDEPLVIQSAPIDVDGFATGTTDYTYTILKSAEELDNIAPITQIHWQATSLTANKGADYVVFTAETGIYIGMGARVQLQIDDDTFEE